MTNDGLGILIIWLVVNVTTILIIQIYLVLNMVKQNDKHTKALMFLLDWVDDVSEYDDDESLGGFKCTASKARAIAELPEKESR